MPNSIYALFGAISLMLIAAGINYLLNRKRKQRNKK